MSHPVGGWTRCEETRVLSIYAFISTNPSAISLAKAHNSKGVIRICISKNRQHNGQKKKYKRTNNDLQNIHIKLKNE
jgi:hypothetical protein